MFYYSIPYNNHNTRILQIDCSSFFLFFFEKVLLTVKKMSDKKLLAQGVMNFFFKKDEGKCLSNFWECDVVIMDEGEVREYGSGENCFHGEKFIRVGKLCEDENRKRELLEYGRKFLKGVCVTDGNVVKKWEENLF